MLLYYLGDGTVISILSLSDRMDEFFLVFFSISELSYFFNTPWLTFNVNIFFISTNRVQNALESFEWSIDNVLGLNLSNVYRYAIILL